MIAIIAITAILDIIAIMISYNSYYSYSPPAQLAATTSGEGRAVQNQGAV